MKRRKFLQVIGLLPAMPVIAKAEALLPAENVEDESASDLGTIEVVGWKTYFRSVNLNEAWLARIT